MKCVSKKQYECIKLTKENLKEFLRIVEPYLDSKYVFIQDDNDKYCLVKRFEVEKYYFYNDWYVFDWDEATLGIKFTSSVCRRASKSIQTTDYQCR